MSLIRIGLPPGGGVYLTKHLDGSGASPAQNFGPAQTLNVSSQSIALVRFDLSSLPALEVDVTQQVKLWVTTPVSNYSLAVVAAGATKRGWPAAVLWQVAVCALPVP